MKRGGYIKRKTPLRRRGESKADAPWRAAREAALERDHYTCQLPVEHDCWGRLEVHHKLPRGRRGGHELDNLVSVCTWGHRWIEEHRAEAYELGLLIRSAA